ncbi:helix-turn-helix transcriptional regulator [Streptomyces achromogenes]|uniref:helix-turn-helix transcriptional regulator n=1 Tax=Streptomyces achromogenes TaxID=67255 RepID=UPI00358E48F2
MPRTITSSVKRARLRQGMTQQDLAEKCAEAGAPVDESHLSRIERGIFRPRPRLRAVLAQVLEIDPDTFDESGPEAYRRPRSSA